MNRKPADGVSLTERMMAKATKPPSSDGAATLLEYVRERDVPCPLCGYNLRNLTRPQCPECREDLKLTVGLLKPRFGWFLATVTPGTASIRSPARSMKASPLARLTRPASAQACAPRQAIMVRASMIVRMLAVPSCSKLR